MTDIQPHIVVASAVPSLIKAALFYPLVYYALNTIACAPYGTLDLMRLECHCPASRVGTRCQTCKVSDKDRGECLRNTVMCHDKRIGALCDICPACPTDTTECEDCTGPCNNNLGYYESGGTKCRACNASDHCSGHGTCNVDTGLCDCKHGYASAFLSLSKQCNVACPGLCGNPSAGHTCTTGGVCKCAAPFCGPMCTQNMAYRDEKTYCSDAGYTIIPFRQADNSQCACDCFTRKGEPIALGDRCQHICPLGRNADVCGEGKYNTPKPYDSTKQKCECKCADGHEPLESGHCDDECKNGAQYGPSGGCVCRIDNQDPETDCAACKQWEGWYNPPLCKAYCDTNTCGRVDDGAHCIPPATGGYVKCQCPSEGHNPDIEQVATITTIGQAEIVPFAITLPERTARRQYIAIQADSDGAFVWRGGDGTDLIHVSTTADIGADTLDLQFYPADSSYHALYTPVPVLWDQNGSNASVIPIQGVSTTAGVAAVDLCAAMDDCVGFDNGTLYSCIDNIGLCTGSSADEAGADLYRLARSVRLKEVYEYNLVLHEVVEKGCHKCKANMYPSSAVETDTSMQCATFCTDEHTCSGYGTCDAYGQCVCINDNIHNNRSNHSCAICKDDYYPAPFTEMLLNASEPCINKCIDEALDDGDGEHWYCSGHGQCIGNGTCHPQCIQFATSEPSGWSGEHCEVPCVADALINGSEVCSGHGTCLDSACACYEGYFGKLCDVTCNQPDEYFYVVQQDCDGEFCHDPCEGLEGKCEENIPCGGVTGEFMCTRLKCNGRACAADYQYTHRGKTFYYEPCNADISNETLRECTGISAEEYNRTGLNGNRIREEHGIYCDTGTRNSHQGFCKKARCDCSDGDIATMVTTDPGNTSIPIDVETLTVAVNLGGKGCYVAGCRPADFPEGGNFNSMCGEHVPPVIGDPVALYDVLNDEQGDVLPLLEKELARVQQHCSHGECLPRRGQPGHSLEYPAPAGAQAVRGYCKCKNTPRTSDTCQLDSNPYWAQQCCDSGSGGSNIFFGRSCTDECKCDRKQFWKGSCGGDDTSAISLGCNCRMGYHENSATNELQELFCGSTCRTQCKGIVDNKGAVVTLSGTYADTHCPGRGANTAVHNASCYVGHYPCHGHGQCSSSDGTCIYAEGNVLASKAVGSCQCWGSGVEMESNAAETLPQVVALYGGEESCELECPFAGQLSNYFIEHYDVLMAANIRLTSQHRAIKQRYFDMYSEKVCSGHGYCTSFSDTAACYNARDDACTNKTHLKCTCTGDFGGNDCDTTCELNTAAWGTNTPWQFGSAAGNGTLGSHLSTYYGLSKCGPNAECTTGYTCGPIDDGQYAISTYDAAKDMVARLTESNASTTKNALFFEQWSLMFVGEFGSCGSGYYSSVLRDLDGQNTIYAFDLPTLVRWQLKRTCDAEYKQNLWSDSGTAWCCKYDERGTEWHDDTAANFNGFTHGGCPDGYCPNFATGRSCRTCISEAYETWRGDRSNTCPLDYNGAGYCAKCTGSQDDHLVSPFSDLHSAGSTSYKADGKDACEHCISYTRELSGEQQYAVAAAESRTCNTDLLVKRGTCNGHPNTYSGIAEQPNDVAKPAVGSLLCEGDEPHFILGLCKCGEDWEGPTCAAPKTQAACGDYGELVSTGVISEYSGMDRPYNKCVCKKSLVPGVSAKTGHYCNGNAAGNIWSFAAAELELGESIQRIPPGMRAQKVVCNDPTGATVAVNGRCESCADPSLDPYSMCIEYKAYGADGIVEQHKARVRDRSNCGIATLSPTPHPTPSPTDSPTPSS